MRQIFSALLNDLYPMLAFIREHAIATGFDPLVVAKIELACEEALVNIISYAYPQGAGSIDILCSEADPPGIKIAIRDQGIPYDPLNPSSPSQKEMGGYGIPLMRKIMDQIQYKREASDNVLTLIKYL